MPKALCQVSFSRADKDVKSSECYSPAAMQKHYAYGIAFCGKQCKVGGGKLREVQATAFETGFPGREGLSSGASCGIR